MNEFSHRLVIELNCFSIRAHGLVTETGFIIVCNRIMHKTPPSLSIKWEKSFWDPNSSHTSCFGAKYDKKKDSAILICIVEFNKML